MSEEAAKIPGSNPGGPTNCFRVVLVNKNVYYMLIFKIHVNGERMPEEMDPSEIDETDCPSHPSQKSFTCAECKTSFPRPLLATISSGGQTQTYYACPRCMTKVHYIKTLEKEEEEECATSIPKPRKGASVPDTDTKCQHFFGYLNKRTKEDPFPEECLTCAKMVDCLFH
jgi:DNA-directed RNA polymerase subunit RPC12/RpoP